MTTGEKTNLRQRLMDEGRWQAFVARRTKAKLELGPEDPLGLVWEIAIKDFPPLNPDDIESYVPPAPPARQQKPEVVLYDPRTFNAESVSERETVKWVASRLVVETEPEDAPSSEAFGMLLWARGSQKDFFSIFGRLATAKDSSGERDQFDDDGHEALRSVEKILKDHEE